MRKQYILQIIILCIGSVFAWYNVLNDFIRFYQLEWTFWKFTNTWLPHPLFTPCFWGACAFMIALIWSVTIFQAAPDLRRARQKKLNILLGAGTIFAWSNFSYEVYKFIQLPPGAPAIGCSGQLIQNPCQTPCFWGAVIFLVAFVSSLLILQSDLQSEKRKAVTNLTKKL